MVLLLRLLGVIAGVLTIVYAISLGLVFGRGDAIAGFGAVAVTVVCLAITVLWFWLAGKLAAVRRAALADRIQLPCAECGSRAAIGYRVCRTCGAPKDPGI